MLRNWLVTAFRNFSRHKLYGFINVVGLAVALACAILIALFLRDELSYDTWIPGTQDIYRVETSYYDPGRGVSSFDTVPFVVTTTMKAQIPEVRDQTHLIPESMIARVRDRMFLESVDFVDGNFFRMFRLPFVEGDPATALAQPESIVLTEAAARKYFGHADPLGKTIILAAAHPVTVTGVLRDLPHNTQFVIDMIVPNTSRADSLPLSEKTGAWLRDHGFGYVELAPGANPGRVLAKLGPILDRNVDVKKEMDVNLPGSKVLQLYLTSFRDVHLNSEEANAAHETAPGSWTVVYGFAAIALLILLVACFNFTNLATARAMIRAREVGLRKVVGAQRVQLIAQFLGESVATALIAALFALAMVELLLPAYDSFLGRPIAFHYVADWPLTVGVFLIAVFCGLLGGLYPAFVLSGIRPVAALEAGHSGSGDSGRLRISLVILQFAISIGLGIAAAVVFAQIRYAREVDLGFDREDMIVIARFGIQTPQDCEALMQALRANPVIAGVATSWTIPFDYHIGLEAVRVPGSHETYHPRWNMIDPDYPRLYGIKLLAGRYIAAKRGRDVNTVANGDGVEEGRNILVNAAAARRFGFGPDRAVGRSIAVQIAKGWARLTIVGVLGDAKIDGLRTAVEPAIYYYNPGDVGWFSVRVKPGHVQEALTFIDRTWRKFVPTRPIERMFLDDSFDKLFAADKQQGEVFGIFVGIAIFIACLGLFGLAAFSAERRTKEIGVRKVFGAKTGEIVGLLLWQFSIPVLIANVIAWPIAWYYLHNWLESYAYRITLSPIYFISAGAAALVIAWATVIAHSLAVARANPVHALRYE